MGHFRGRRSRPQLYLASPVGFSELGNKVYPGLVAVIRKAGFRVLDPWRLPRQLTAALKKLMKLRRRFLKEAWRKKAGSEWNWEVGTRNAQLIEEADGIFAILDGQDVDSGTASEIGYGAALGKPVLGYRGDFRLAADNEASTVNLQVEYFIKKNGGRIITKLKHLKTALSQLRALMTLH